MTRGRSVTTCPHRRRRQPVTRTDTYTTAQGPDKVEIAGDCERNGPNRVGRTGVYSATRGVYKGAAARLNVPASERTHRTAAAYQPGGIPRRSASHVERTSPSHDGSVLRVHPCSSAT